MSEKKLRRSSSTAPPCRYLRVRLHGEVEPGILHGAVVSVGLKLGELEVIYCFPSPCRVTSRTCIELGDSTCRAEKIYEDDETVAYLVERAGERRVHVVSKEVWSSIRKALDVFERGKTTGILLFGPPGSGKSSLLDILRGLYGIAVVEVSPEKIFRPHFGESEKELDKAFRELKRKAPAIMFIDECDVFFRGSVRQESVIAPGSGAERVFQSLRNIFLRKMQELHSHVPPVLFLAATNVPVKYLDAAFRRAGRFDTIVHVPNPTWRQIYVFLKLYAEYINKDHVERLCKIHGLSMSDLEYLSKLLANFGLSMADVVHVVTQGKHVKDYVTAKEESGYRRMVSLYPNKVGGVGLAAISSYARRLVMKIKNYYSMKLHYCPRMYISRRLTHDLSASPHVQARAAVHDHRYLLLPLLVHIFTEEGIPVVYVSELSESNLKDAMLTAYESKGILIVNLIAETATVFPSVIQTLAESPCPVLCINSPELPFAEDLSVLVRQLIADLVAKPAYHVELVKIYAENLGLKLSHERAEVIARQTLTPGGGAQPETALVDLVNMVSTLVEIAEEEPVPPPQPKLERPAGTTSLLRLNYIEIRVKS